MKDMQIMRSIQNRIYELRGERVMLDFDLAALYEVSAKVLNQAVKRNSGRFPKDFMFRLTAAEWQEMRSQFETASDGSGILRSQFVTSKTGSGGNRYLPYAFTEQGVAMLSGILNSERAIAMNPDSYRDHYAGFCRNPESVVTGIRFERAAKTN